MFEKLFKAAANVAIAPAAVAADLVTGGGMMTDQDKPYTVKAIEGAVNNVGKALDDIA